MDDQMDLFEQRGMNHALWAWDPSWEPWAEENDAFNFRHGPDPDHHADVASSDLMDVIVKYWRRNTVRPSSAVAPSNSAAPLPSVPTATSPSEARLADVSHWFYMINVNLEPEIDDYPDSTLRVSSQEYLHYLTLARDKGEIIFTVDYALEPDNVAWVYETSRALGFVPFASNRGLDGYVEPVP